MFLLGGRIPKKLYPGVGGTHSQEIEVPGNVENLYAVMNGFVIEYSGGDHHIKKMEIDLHVHHEPGMTTATLKCDFNLRDENTSGDTFWAACDYLIIGK
jgi:hypothetical protein